MTKRGIVEVLWHSQYVGNPPSHQEGILIVDGFSVPGLVIQRALDPAEDGRIAVELNGRFQHNTTDDELLNWGWILANAMAFSAGFSCFGPNARPRSSYFGSEVHVITGIDDTERAVYEGEEE